LIERGEEAIAALVALAELGRRGGDEERTDNREAGDISGPPLRARQMAGEQESFSRWESRELDR